MTEKKVLIRPALMEQVPVYLLENNAECDRLRGEAAKREYRYQKGNQSQRWRHSFPFYTTLSCRFCISEISVWSFCQLASLRVAGSVAYRNAVGKWIDFILSQCSLIFLPYFPTLFNTLPTIPSMLLLSIQRAAMTRSFSWSTYTMLAPAPR